MNTEFMNKACFRDIPKKDLYVADLIHYLSNKEIVTIIYDDGDTPKELFDGRVEDLQYTSDGCLHDAALCEVHSMEVSTDNKFLIFVVSDQPTLSNRAKPKEESLDTFMDILKKCPVGEKRLFYVNITEHKLVTKFGNEFDGNVEYDISYMVKDFQVFKYILPPDIDNGVVEVRRTYVSFQFFSCDTPTTVEDPRVCGIICDAIIKNEYLYV